jgi:hypothetical protein
VRRCDTDNAGTPQLATMSLTRARDPVKTVAVVFGVPTGRFPGRTEPCRSRWRSLTQLPEHLPPVRLRQILPAGEHL